MRPDAARLPLPVSSAAGPFLGGCRRLVLGLAAGLRFLEIELAIRRAALALAAGMTVGRGLVPFDGGLVPAEGLLLAHRVVGLARLRIAWACHQRPFFDRSAEREWSAADCSGSAASA